MRRVTSVGLPRDMNPSLSRPGDLDADSWSRIVVAGGGNGLAASVSDALVVLRNQTASAGARPRFALTSYAGTPAADLALGGFDADGQALDVAVLAAEAAGATPFVRLNDGTGLLGDERPTAGAGLLLADSNLNAMGPRARTCWLSATTRARSPATTTSMASAASARSASAAGRLWFAGFAIADVNGDGLDVGSCSRIGANRQFVGPRRRAHHGLDWPLRALQRPRRWSPSGKRSTPAPTTPADYFTGG
jgi:hypothetical protein